MQKTCITYSFIVDNPDIFGNYCCPYLGSPEYFRKKKIICIYIYTHIRDIQAPPNRSCMRCNPPDLPQESLGPFGPEAPDAGARRAPETPRGTLSGHFRPEGPERLL